MTETLQTSPALADSLTRRVVQSLSGRVALLVALYAAAVYLPFLGAGRPLTRHEVFITQPALQMLSDGHWLVPQYANRVWIQKPPLISWVTAGLFMASGGFHEWAARLPAALSAIGLCILVTVVARRFYGDLPALLTGLVQATCVYMYRQGRLGEVDMPFAFFLVAAQCILAWHWGHGAYRLPLRWAVALHVLTALAVMTKGPLAVVLLGVTVLSFCGIRRSLQPLRAVLWTPAIFAFLAVAVPWYIAVTWRLDAADLRTWTYDSLGRFSGEHHLGAQPFYMYLYTIPWVMLPWTIVLVLGARQLYSAVRRPEAVFERFLSSWFLGGLVLLSICAFKHHHYCIPILPPLSLFAGKMLAEHTVRIGQQARRFYIGLFVAILVILGVVSSVVLPIVDRGTRLMADFLEQSVAHVPSDAPVYVLGLGESGAYPYIRHRCIYPSSPVQVQSAMDGLQGRPVWVLTLRAYVSGAEGLGWLFETVASEPVRKGHVADESLVLGRVSRLAGAHVPASSLSKMGSKE